MIRLHWHAGLPWLAAVLIGMTGCASTGSTAIRSFDARSNRRNIDRTYVSTPDFGAPRGRRFEDLVPIGARIAAVNAVVDGSVKAVWLTYERNGDVRETPRRGDARGRTQSFKLGRNEKIIGIHGWGRGGLDAIAVATNRRTYTFGDPGAVGHGRETLWFEELTMDQKQDYVGIGITGRADEVLRQISLRLQVQDAQMARARP